MKLEGSLRLKPSLSFLSLDLQKPKFHSTSPGSFRHPADRRLPLRGESWFEDFPVVASRPNPPAHPQTRHPQTFPERRTWAASPPPTSSCPRFPRTRHQRGAAYGTNKQVLPGTVSVNFLDASVFWEGWKTSFWNVSVIPFSGGVQLQPQFSAAMPTIKMRGGVHEL